MSENAKNELLELLDDLGCSKDCVAFQPTLISSGFHHSTVTVQFPDGRTIQGTGRGQRSPNADIAAAQSVLDQLHANHRDLLIDWDKIKVEAQAGDALIKLSVYLSSDLKNADDRSKRLQKLESDSHLATVFDQWKVQGDSDLVMWGTELGEKRKATLVEAILWRRFRTQIITTDVSVKLQSLLKLLSEEA
ncbi:MAG TPA: hypothetical protein V6D10_17660 [Trichocoleus sp.]|jgi:hypothetical protein